MDEIGLNASVVGRLQDLVLDSEDVSGFLEDLAVFTASSVSAARAQDVLCGVTLSRRRRSMTVAGSSREARLIDEVQQAYGDGPCLEAMRTGKSVLVSDTSADSRWPEYCATIAERGHLAVLCVPLGLEEGATAAINLFAPQRDAFDEASVHSCEQFANQAEKALKLAVRIGATQQRAEDLEQAMRSRTAIDLATGVIMGQNRCSQEEAFRILTKASNGRNQKLREVAESLLLSLSNETPVLHFEP
ncbi:GAF and ANTAR domain-containing protein [Arthrobacter sp. NPDC080031]|uniref:GAF and ANTAR domain-containing protein n=1 Tax=Arthrobacter sp. NPDC080031 TaxID=3155918 RepID=UPI00344EE319